MSELAREKAERFAEKTGAEIYNAMFSQYKELAQATTNIDKRVSALEVAGPLREQLLKDLSEVEKNLAKAHHYETECPRYEDKKY